MAAHIVFSDKLYLGESISAKKLDKIKKKLISKPFLANVWLITLAHNPSDQLDLLDARQLIQRHYDDVDFHVYGIAASREEAFSIVERITQDCLAERGDCRLREFLI